MFRILENFELSPMGRRAHVVQNILSKTMFNIYRESSVHQNTIRVKY